MKYKLTSDRNRNLQEITLTAFVLIIFSWVIWVVFKGNNTTIHYNYFYLPFVVLFSSLIYFLFVWNRATITIEPESITIEDKRKEKTLVQKNNIKKISGNAEIIRTSRSSSIIYTLKITTKDEKIYGFHIYRKSKLLKIIDELRAYNYLTFEELVSNKSQIEQEDRKYLLFLISLIAGLIYVMFDQFFNK